MFLTLTLTAETRVRTADGEAMIRHTLKKVNKAGKESFEVKELSNEVPKKWVKLPAGTVIHNCGYFRRSDTYLCAVELPATDNDPSTTVGVVLRQMSWEKCVASSEEGRNLPETVEPVVETTSPEQDPLAAIEAAGGSVQEVVGDPSSEGEAPVAVEVIAEPVIPVETEKPSKSKKSRKTPSVEDLLEA